jgi:hypothetical protein
MKHYALIFHTTRTFTPEQQKQRFFRFPQQRAGRGHRAHPPRLALWSHRRSAGVDLSARACRRGDTMKLVVLGAV